MATKRIAMRQLREILRLRLHANLSMRQIRDSLSLRLSLGAIQKAVSKAEELDLHWEAIEKLDDQQLAAKIYPQADAVKSSNKVLPDWVEIYGV